MIKVKLLSDFNIDSNITIEGKMTKEKFSIINNYLDHAILNKKDIYYNDSEGILEIKLLRNCYEKKKQKKFLWFSIWDRNYFQTSLCLLTIKKVIDCKIRDEDLPKNNEVVIGGIFLEDENKLYIGSFCEQDNKYGIDVKVKTIDIELKDLEK